jgi:hypothetical protein
MAFLTGISIIAFGLWSSVWEGEFYMKAALVCCGLFQIVSGAIELTPQRLAETELVLRKFSVALMGLQTLFFLAQIIQWLAA